MKDVVIIGAGIIGASIARELSRYNADILVLEKGNDVAVGTTKANSGIVHAGFDAKADSQKAKYNLLGNGMFDALSEELDFPFRRNGSLVLCFDKDAESEIHRLFDNGLANGVSGLRILTGDEARSLEPNISGAVCKALYAETGGIVSPYDMNLAYAENAYTNGVGFRFGAELESLTANEGGFEIRLKGGERIAARAVVNAAGVGADDVNNSINSQKYNITARKGDYLLFDKTCGHICNRTLFQLPSKMGKGILVTPTVHGNLLIGPTARDIGDKEDASTTTADLNEVFSKARLSVPALSKRDIITQFSGLRAHEAGDDFVVGESATKGFFNALGIESPGLTSAPAIAVELAGKIAERLELNENPYFEPKRQGIRCFAEMTAGERENALKENRLYGRVVCRCETVTEAEIVDAIRRPLGAKDLDGIKRRTRAGMGRCQAGFCTPRLMEILARELSIDICEVTKSGGGSRLLVGRSK